MSCAIFSWKREKKRFPAACLPLWVGSVTKVQPQAAQLFSVLFPHVTDAILRILNAHAKGAISYRHNHYDYGVTSLFFVWQYRAGTKGAKGAADSQALQLSNPCVRQNHTASTKLVFILCDMVRNLWFYLLHIATLLKDGLVYTYIGLVRLA